MEAHLEVPMESSFGAKRVVIPTVIIIALVAMAGGGFFYMKSKKADAAGAAGTGAAAAKGKNGNGKDKEKAPVPVSVTPVALAPISSYLTSTANLVAENEVKIVAEAEGRIERLLVEEGVFVKQGQTLAVLNRGDAEMVVEKARVRAANARVAYDRAHDMYSKGLMSKGDYEKSSMEKQVADQELAESRWRLGKTTIRAPFSGRVTQRMINQGQHVRPGAEMFTLTDFDPLIARIFLPERDVVTLKEGREVRLALRADEKITFKGRIRQISPVVDTATGTVKVTVEAVNPPEVVRPGAFITVGIVRETHPNAVRLPREAVVREMRDAHIFIVEGNLAKRREVTLGIEEGDFVEALSGVKPGEKVIVAGQGGLKDGALIKILPAAKG